MPKKDTAHWKHPAADAREAITAALEHAQATGDVCCAVEAEAVGHWAATDLDAMAALDEEATVVLGCAPDGRVSAQVTVLMDAVAARKPAAPRRQRQTRTAPKADPVPLYPASVETVEAIEQEATAEMEAEPVAKPARKPRPSRSRRVVVEDAE